VQPDPAQRFLMMQSAPIVIPSARQRLPRRERRVAGGQLIRGRHGEDATRCHGPSRRAHRARHHHDGGRHVRPRGKVVSVPADEVAGLKARGVVLPDDYEAPREVQDGRLKVTAESGVNVTSIGIA
jgi:hypothetical protein